MAELLGQSLQPRGFVDGAADDREVEPLVGANIAVHHLSHVQGDADLQRLARRIECGDVLHGPHRGASARWRMSTSTSGRSERKIPMTASPMNFKTSPPASMIAPTVTSKYRLSRTM